MPLANSLRPKKLSEVIGQKHLLGKGKPLGEMIKSKQISSCILYGPAGCGKTTIARLIAGYSESAFAELNAVSATVKEIRAIGEQAKEMGTPTTLFIDEVYKFSKTQQSVLLPYTEDGSIIFVGATTENPFHSLSGTLISRSLIYELEPLSAKDLCRVIDRGIRIILKNVSNDFVISEKAIWYIADVCCGDARKCLTVLEAAVVISKGKKVTLDLVKEIIPNKHMALGAEEHFDYASAFQGSIQASDPDSAVYWLARWLESGEDPRYIARRLMVSASEDATSSPVAAAVAHAAYTSAKEIGRPECDIILSHAAILVAIAPRDKSACVAIHSALADIRDGEVKPVPKEMKDCHYKGAAKLGRGGYQDGADQSKYIGVDKRYYRPGDWQNDV